jgi:hypothetical protein
VQAIKQHPFFSSIDFDSIWTIEPPPLETGIVAPAPTPARHDHFPDIDWDEGEVYDGTESEQSSTTDGPPSTVGGSVSKKANGHHHAERTVPNGVHVNGVGANIICSNLYVFHAGDVF